MKIVDIECHLLTCQQRFSAAGPILTSSGALIRVVTDEGLYGLGDPLSAYHVPEAIPPLVHFYRQELLGEDPRRISHLWRKMHSASLFWGRSGAALSVIAGIVLHNPSLGAGMMFGLHLAFARRACELIEIIPIRTALHRAVLAEPLRFEGGWLLPPTLPGAGLVWHDDLPRQFPFIPGSGERQGEG